jgi:hypothetical protein
MEITGVVKDSTTGETIPGAVVFKSDVLGKSIGNGTSTDIDGKYKLTNINDGDYITAQILGKQPLTQKAQGNKLDFGVGTSASTTLGTFEVFAPKPEPKPESKPPSASTQPPPKKDKTNWVLIGVGVVVLGVTILAVRKLAKR